MYQYTHLLVCTHKGIPTEYCDFVAKYASDTQEFKKQVDDLFSECMHSIGLGSKIGLPDYSFVLYERMKLPE